MVYVPKKQLLRQFSWIFFSTSHMGQDICFYQNLGPRFFWRKNPARPDYLMVAPLYTTIADAKFNPAYKAILSIIPHF